MKKVLGKNSIEDLYDMTEEEMAAQKEKVRLFEERMKNAKHGDDGVDIRVLHSKNDFVDSEIEMAFKEHFQVFNNGKKKSTLTNKQKETLKKLRDEFDHSEDDENEEYLDEIEDGYISKLLEYKSKKRRKPNNNFAKKVIRMQRENQEEYIKDRRKVDEQFAKHTEF
ncbi:hypothetical protein MHBO_004077 [Bonamia ostreae]|uniref:Ribosomal RNA-processing protein 7 C-terminal domain-containing protein n=1 Tax=Bonamia ostreae TaxID=126728 RepID=A0ABV2ASB0_9EUKA